MTTPAQLDTLIEELTVDAYDDDEQLSGFLTGAEEALRQGETARIVGVDIEVLEVDAGPDVRTGLTARVSGWQLPLAGELSGDDALRRPTNASSLARPVQSLIPESA